MHVYSSSAVNTICGTIKAVFLSQIFLPFFLFFGALFFAFFAHFFSSSSTPPYPPSPLALSLSLSLILFSLLFRHSIGPKIGESSYTETFVCISWNESLFPRFSWYWKCIKIIYRKGFGHFISRSLLTNLFYCCIWEMIK